MNEFLAVFIAGLGLLAGRVINALAKEEIKAGQRYFPTIAKAIAGVFVVAWVVLTPVHLAIKGALVLAAAALFFIDLIKLVLPGYIVMGLLLSLAPKEYLPLLASLIFLFGIPVSALQEKPTAYYQVALPQIVLLLSFSVFSIF